MSYMEQRQIHLAEEERLFSQVFQIPVTDEEVTLIQGALNASIRIRFGNQKDNRPVDEFVGAVGNILCELNMGSQDAKRRT